MTGNFIHPSLITRLAACALLAAYLFVAAFTPSPTAAQQPTPKVSLTSESNTVRFDLQGEARAWQLEIFSLSGDLLYASGPVNDQKFEWPLQDRHGEPLGGGLYSYTLKFLDERNETTAIRRGYFVLDSSYAGAHIWMAGNSVIGVGGAASELTVIGATEGAIGEAKLTGELVSSSRNATQQGQPTIIQACPSNIGD